LSTVCAHVLRGSANRLVQSPTCGQHAQRSRWQPGRARSCGGSAPAPPLVTARPVLWSGGRLVAPGAHRHNVVDGSEKKGSGYPRHGQACGVGTSTCPRRGPLDRTQRAAARTASETAHRESGAQPALGTIATPWPQGGGPRRLVDTTRPRCLHGLGGPPAGGDLGAGPRHHRRRPPRPFCPQRTA
jgi:hypothetical protein